MYRPHSSTKEAKTRSYDLVLTEHANGALSAKLICPYDGFDNEEVTIGSPNGRTSEHGFFTTLGLAIGEQFKKA
jgi:hypothetical protein